MLIRLLKIPRSLVLLLAILAFFTWQLSQGSSHEPTDASPRAPGKANKKTARIALMTFVTEQRSYLHLSLKNKDHYARRHGYDFVVDYEAHNDRTVMFWKFDMAEKLIKSGKYDWLWWIDFDTLITNTATKVTDIIEDELRNATNPDDIDFLLTHDCNGLNAGSFLVRGHERSLKFMHKSVAVYDEAKRKDVSMSEQDAVVKLLNEDKKSANRARVIPQWKLNAFPSEIACFDEEQKVWEHGMFVLHFAGAWAHVKGEDPTGYLMNKYEGDIMWGDWKEFY
ncbi:uncharacterized protein EKO05_0000647 [Ascochyta rabiei]|uniref:Transferase n=1 Tax=Didymella rabiei TaxID=5454 RepID=A0A163HM56_DIDRA|nr:uncharacterized protein EKO05_0000647 [Ascochyta rabiei]KZM25361.1 transferase [Ascochyta rabiei]UPX09971.1 hypothetical protein EKO05_0000647 [Ascochyta rabiei]